MAERAFLALLNTMKQFTGIEVLLIGGDQGHVGADARVDRRGHLDRLVLPRRLLLTARLLGIL